MSDPGRPRAIFVSPHLDDAVFSAGAYMASLAAAGWDVVLVSCFTRSVRDPRGFALRCQLAAGVPVGADYMGLRREEDRRAASRLGCSGFVHLDLADAPHRGYDSAAALVAGVRPDDRIDVPLARELRGLAGGAGLVALPQGRGGHVDHEQTLRAARAAGLLAHPSLRLYADVPDALRAAHARPSPTVPPGLIEQELGASADSLERKLDACAEYATQLAGAFGGELEMRRALARAPERIAGRPRG